MQEWALEQRALGRRLGLVPTMGGLHKGHGALIEAALPLADTVIVSIFVNPTQFGPDEDFAAYPRQEEQDLESCRAAGAGAVFVPAPAGMYADDASTFIDESLLSQGLCGARRPGHFKGVCTVVAKLFNLALPHVAVFGEKDFQQVAVVKRMVRDLNFPVEIAVVPTVREADGLALSSRNAYLSAAARQRALGLIRALRASRELLAAGEERPETHRRTMRELLAEHALRPDYVEIVDADTLQPVESVRPGCVALAAAYCDQVRLIDNLTL